jgi:hypothetical protein
MQRFTTWNVVKASALLGGLLLPQLLVAESLRDNIVVILDASGSMKDPMRGSGRQKMQVAKEALREVLVRSLSETTNLGILVFSAGNLKNDVLYPLGPVDRAKLEKVIMLPEPGHGTPLGTYLKKGADMLLEQWEKQEGYGTYRLLVVTDGKANDGKLVDRFLPDILSRGIGVDVIGVDMKSDHPLATRVDSYRKADDPKALAAAISEVLAEIGGADEDVPGSDAFSLLETIPNDLASAMLAALTETRSEPIGARRTPSSARSTVSSQSSPRTPPPSPPPPRQRAPVSTPDQGGDDDDDWASWPTIIVFLIIIVVASKRIKKFGRR